MSSYLTLHSFYLLIIVSIYYSRKMYNIYNVSSIDEQVPISHTGYPKWDITLTLLFAWIVAYLCICKGIKSSGKVSSKYR